MTVLVAIAAVAAIVDWIAVAKNRIRVETIAKPLVMVLLVAAVLTGGSTRGPLLVGAGLCCSALGDVLLLPRFDRFIQGLSAFLAAHVLFVSAFLVSAESFRVIPVVLGSSVALVMAIALGLRIIGAARHRDPRLARAVAIYVAVLCLMVAASFTTGSVVAAAGAVLFAGSDGILGWNRFVEKLHHGRLLTHIPYHLGQGLIAVWAITLS